jgi:hypothetical protein
LSKLIKNNKLLQFCASRLNKINQNGAVLNNFFIDFFESFKKCARTRNKFLKRTKKIQCGGCKTRFRLKFDAFRSEFGAPHLLSDDVRPYTVKIRILASEPIASELGAWTTCHEIASR